MNRIKQFLERLGANFRIYTLEQFHELLTTRNYPPYITTHRSYLGIERVRIFSLCFALLMPFWLLFDYMSFEWETFKRLVYVKGGISVIFVLLAWPVGRFTSSLAYHIYLAVFLTTFPLIFLLTNYLLLNHAFQREHATLLQRYALLPYMSVAGLGLFPLTLLETLSYAISLSVLALSGWYAFIIAPLMDYVASAGILLIMTGLALLSSTIQLQDMLSLVSRPAYDPLTGALSRRSGNNMLVREFETALLHDGHLAIALIELHEVESLTNSHGVATYDLTILEVADILREDLRSSDSLIRWGDEAFLIVFPHTDCKGANVIIERLRRIGLGTLPDGEPITAGIGLVDREVDQVDDWRSLLELANRRVAQANQSGRDQTVYCGQRVVGPQHRR